MESETLCYWNKRTVFCFCFPLVWKLWGYFPSFLFDHLFARNRAKKKNIFQSWESQNFCHTFESIVWLILCYEHCIIHCSAVFFIIPRQEFNHIQSMISLRVTIEKQKEVRIRIAESLSYRFRVSKVSHDRYLSPCGLLIIPLQKFFV